MELVPVEKFNYSYFDKIAYAKRPRGNNSGKTANTYADVVCAFDIETTRIIEIEQAVMYIWQFQVGLDYTVIGRTWEEYQVFLSGIDAHLPRDMKLIIFVHNLSYEFQFLRGIYSFAENEVFAVKSRKVLKCVMNDRFEYRCSYLLTNMSLSQATSKYQVEHGKLSGDEFDYNKQRYSWTEMTEREIEYCVNDVRGLVEVIYKIMEINNDTLYTLPLTSTGFVRRDAKRAMHSYRKMVASMEMSMDLYKLMKWALRGGNTHANRFYSNRLVRDVKSFDRSSSYPDVLCNCKYPVKEFSRVLNADAAKLHKYVFERNKPILTHLVIENVRLKNDLWGCPYIAYGKCKNVLNPRLDNGRILSADRLECALTDIDYKIVCDEYDFDIVEVVELYYSSYGKLPKPFIDCVIQYYRDKTELKDVDGQEIFYTKSKNLLNSLYGMCAQDPVKVTILFDGVEFKEDENADIQAILDKSNKKAFLPYAWGVWVTAWARLRLEEGIKLSGPRFVYTDTDSVKYVGDVDWTDYNNERIADSISSGAYATDIHGVTHYMGVYEQEHTMDYFKTLGAKKYAYSIDGKLSITIAGVGKKRGAAELLEMSGGDAYKAIRDYFAPGTLFTAGGGTESVYNDVPEITEYTVDGHVLRITPNVVIRPSTYKLNITDEYRRLLYLSKEDFKKLIEIVPN